MLERLRNVQNAHDAEGMAALFAEDYASSQPLHAGRAFVGRAQVLENWTAVFEGVPDFVSELVSYSIDGNTEWGEWYWHGRHLDGSAFAMRGVTIFVVRSDLIAEALVKAGRSIGFKVPVVVRLEGTNVDKAREILAAAHKDLPTLQSATDLTDAAKKVTAAVAA